MSDELKNAIEEVRNLSADVRDIEDGAPYATKTYVTSILHRTMQAAIRLQSYALATLAAREEEQRATSALRDLHIAMNAMLYAIDNDIELDGVMANARKVIEDSQTLVFKALQIESEQKHGE